ncbi:zinc finger protein 467, related [Neospora caninum Liverpool]|uniref:Zinc finger protein 467, related n=1 Tax=Neospora caninum (strain Liverpool) TaxID=572307 RepID=F0VAZ4_NEOCL|nr:zinc finger protein 467, related [Neospora caninum Liverpool]CBZ51370.1 zinc finger protein 467, related [Neospora caninum Liverpool]CEL68689.1 TPA: Zinc finger protein 467, related [Neospora caninum Liverpool]|eukprot:XP_003881403.1 zinc finger protein 467, related [Neospora caninum Liverpool]
MRPSAENETVTFRSGSAENQFLAGAEQAASVPTTHRRPVVSGLSLAEACSIELAAEGAYAGLVEAAGKPSEAMWGADEYARDSESPPGLPPASLRRSKRVGHSDAKRVGNHDGEASGSSTGKARPMGQGEAETVRADVAVEQELSSSELREPVKVDDAALDLDSAFSVDTPPRACSEAARGCESPFRPLSPPCPSIGSPKKRSPAAPATGTPAFMPGLADGADCSFPLFRPQSSCSTVASHHFSSRGSFSPLSFSRSASLLGEQANLAKDAFSPVRRKEAGPSAGGKGCAQSPGDTVGSGDVPAVDLIELPPRRSPSILPQVDEGDAWDGETREEQEPLSEALQGTPETDDGDSVRSALLSPGAAGRTANSGTHFEPPAHPSGQGRACTQNLFQDPETGSHIGTTMPEENSAESACGEMSPTSARDDPQSASVSDGHPVDSLDAREPETFGSDSAQSELPNLLAPARQSPEVSSPVDAPAVEGRGDAEEAGSSRHPLRDVLESSPTAGLTEAPEGPSEGDSSLSETAPEERGSSPSAAADLHSVPRGVGANFCKQAANPSRGARQPEQERDCHGWLLQQFSFSTLPGLAAGATNSFTAERKRGEFEHTETSGNAPPVALPEETIEQIAKTFGSTEADGMEEETLEFDETLFPLGTKKQRRGTSSTSCSEVSGLSSVKEKDACGGKKLKRASAASKSKSAQSALDDLAELSAVHDVKHGLNDFILSALRRCAPQSSLPGRNSKPFLWSLSDTSSPEWLRKTQEPGAAFQNAREDSGSALSRSGPASASSDEGCQDDCAWPSDTFRRFLSGHLETSRSSPFSRASPSSRAESSASRSVSPVASCMGNRSARSCDRPPSGGHTAETVRAAEFSEEALRAFLASSSVSSLSRDLASQAATARNAFAPRRTAAALKTSASRTPSRTLSELEARWDSVSPRSVAAIHPGVKIAASSPKAMSSAAHSMSQSMDQCVAQLRKGTSKGLHPYVSFAAMSLLDAMAAKPPEEQCMFIEGLQTACAVLRGADAKDFSGDSAASVLSAIVARLSRNRTAPPNVHATPATADRQAGEHMVPLLDSSVSERGLSFPTASSTVSVVRPGQRSAPPSKCEESQPLLASVAGAGAKPKAMCSVFETAEASTGQKGSGSKKPESRKRGAGSVFSASAEEEKRIVRRSSVLDGVSPSALRSAHLAEKPGPSLQPLSTLLCSLMATGSQAAEPGMGAAGAEGESGGISRRSSENRTTCTAPSALAKAQRKRSRRDSRESGDTTDACGGAKFTFSGSSPSNIAPGLNAAKPTTVLSSACFVGQPQALAELSALFQCGPAKAVDEIGSGKASCQRVKAETTGEPVTASGSACQTASQSLEKTADAEVRLWRFPEARDSPPVKAAEDVKAAKEGGKEGFSTESGKTTEWATTAEREEQTGARGTQPPSVAGGKRDRVAISRNGTRTAARMYACPLCNGLFSRNYNLHHHIRAVHEGAKPFVCPICHKTFSYKRGNLEQHIQAVHRGEKPFQCKICGRAFSQKGNLSQHTQAVHAGNRPFQCPQCSRSFSRKSHLHRHITSLKHYGPAGSSAGIQQLSGGILESELAKDADSSS